MGRAELRGRVPGMAAAELFRRLREVERYPDLSPSVRSLRVLEREGNRLVAEWEVEFHGGIMRWTQEDLFRPGEHAIRFRQLQGDIEAFEGEYTLRDEADGCIVWFQATFELGIPNLDDILEPIAEEALLANIRSVLDGVSGGRLELL